MNEKECKNVCDDCKKCEDCEEIQKEFTINIENGLNLDIFDCIKKSLLKIGICEFIKINVEYLDKIDYDLKTIQCQIIVNKLEEFEKINVGQNGPGIFYKDFKVSKEYNTIINIIRKK